MPKNKILIIPNSVYFATYKVVKGVHMFKEDKYALIAVQSLEFLRQHKRMYLFSFIVMPHHIHFIYKPRGGFTPSLISGQFISFTAHEILKTCRDHGPEKWLSTFQLMGKEKSDRENAIWQNGLIKTLTTEYHYLQKLEYIHNNPVAKNWHLCDERSDYPYSSACYYDYNRQPIIPVDNISEIEWDE